jgi:hypothetical protein
VQRASGIPCALFIFEGEDYLQTSGELSREIEKLRFVVIARSTCDDLSAEAQRTKAEAIHAKPRGANGLLRFARNDGRVNRRMAVNSPWCAARGRQ